METPLHQQTDEIDGIDEQDSSQTFRFDSEPLDLRKELRQTWNLIWPVTLSTMFHFIIDSTDAAFVGHINTQALAGVMLARVWMDCLRTFAYAPGWALNTLCSQAIGAGNPTLAGNWLQLAIVVCSVLNFMCVGFFWMTGSVLSLVTHDAAEIQYGTLFARWAGGWLLPSVLFFLLSQYFNSMEIVIPEALMAFVFVGINIVLNQLFIHGLRMGSLVWNGLGFVGSPLATLVSAFAQCICFWLIMFVWKKYHTNFWNGWSRDSFQWSRIKTFISIAGPMTLAAGVETWGYQIGNMMTGKFAPSDTATMSVLIAMTDLGFACFVGIGLAVTIRVGNLMGAGQVRNCQQIVKYGAMAIFVVGCLVLLVTIVARDYIGMIWSDDEAVVARVAELAPWVGGWFLVGSLGWIAISVLEGMGRTAIGTLIYAVGVWCVYFPISTYVAYYSGVECGICWLWYIAFMSEFAKTVAVWIVLFRTDWYAMSKLARRNAEVDERDGVSDEKEEVEMAKEGESEQLEERLLEHVDASQNA